MIDIFGKIAYTITRTWFCRILSNHVEMCQKKVHEILSNSSFSIDFSKIIVYTKDRERRFSKNRIRKGFINMKKKILSKAAAVLAVGAIVTGLSGAMAVPASAIDISSVPGSKFQYTLTTKKVSSTKFDVTFNVINNPGVTSFFFDVVGDEGLRCNSVKDMNIPSGSGCTPIFDNRVGGIVFAAPPTGPTASTSDTYAKMSITFEFEVIKNISSEHTLQAGMLTYDSRTEHLYFSAEIGDDFTLPSDDATIMVTPSQSVRLGDVDCNGKIDSTDVFYLRQMVLEAPNNKLSTTYLDRQLKNTNSSWHKNYSFMKCAAVADINRDEWIQSDDTDALMLYVAQKGAGVATSNKDINTLLPVTVVYDN